jgi:hypothetical protein
MHSPALSQTPQSTGWFFSTSSSMVLRRALTFSESVSTRRPLVAGMLQAMSIQPPLSASTSTMHSRQFPAMDRFGCQQK